MAIVRSATTSENAAQMLRDALADTIRDHADDPDQRRAQLLALAGSQLFGLAVARHIVKVPAITQLALDDLVAEVAPTIQRYLTGKHL